MTGVFRDWLVIAPSVIALFGLALCTVFWRRPAAQAIIGIWTCSAILALAVLLAAEVWATGPVAMSMSSWQAPFGIAFAADRFNAGLVVVTAVIGLVIAVYGVGTVDEDSRSYGFYPLLIALVFGVIGGFLTADMFNLYVWLEVMLISSFGLLVLGGSREQIDGAVKYAVVNLVATTFFLIATGLLYGATGTLNMADLSLIIGETGMTGTLTVVATLYLLALGMKAAAFPLFFWLPASYHTPAPAVSALFAALLTKVGVYALLRVFTLVFPVTGGWWAEVFLIIAVATMLIGAIGALAQSDLRRMAAFLVVSGIGYMLVGLGLTGRESADAAMTGSIMYVIHSMVITACLFLGVGLARRVAGSSVIGEMGGVYAQAPALAFLILIASLSVAGAPPFSGVWPKIILVKAGLDAGSTVTVVAVLVAGFLSLMAVGRAFALGIWRNRDEGAPELPSERVGAAALSAFALLAVATLALGLWPQALEGYAAQSVEDLRNPAAYVDAVLRPVEH